MLASNTIRETIRNSNGERCVAKTTDDTIFTDEKALSKELSTVAGPPMYQATRRACFIRVINVIRGAFWDVVYNLSASQWQIAGSQQPPGQLEP